MVTMIAFEGYWPEFPQGWIDLLVNKVLVDRERGLVPPSGARCPGAGQRRLLKDAGLISYGGLRDIQESCPDRPRSACAAVRVRVRHHDSLHGRGQAWADAIQSEVSAAWQI